MSKTIVLSQGVAATLFATTANAADLARKAPAFVPAPLVYNWTGVYVGGHLGYGWSTSRLDSPVGGPSISGDGVLGGGQIGFNYQVGQWVLGLEGDISASGIKGSTRIEDDTIDARLRWTSLVTGRLGYAVDRYLPYIKGGAAFGNTKYTSRDMLGADSASYNRTGWTIGGGLEVALDQAWSLRTEYDYIQFGKKNVVGENGDVASLSYRSHQIRLGVNYRFGGR